MYVKYGTFQFDPSEAGLAVRAQFIRSRRGFKAYQRVQYDIDGEICENNQYDVTTRLNQIIAAFSVDGQDIGLYHDDDSPSTHFMGSNWATNLTGNQVLYKDFPVTEHGEYTSGRKFKLAVGALLYNADVSLIEHADSLNRISNAGQQWRWKRNKWWGFYPILEAPSTMQVIHHVGYRVGMDTWPLPITPFYSPPFEANHLRRVTQRNPIRHPQGYTEFRTDWHYVYTLPTFDDISTPTTS